MRSGIALLGAGVVALAACGGDTPTDTRKAESADVYVAASGSDEAACTREAPCRTFNRAYAAAAPGDVIEVAAGTYETQEIAADPAKPAGAAVVVRPAHGGEVVVEGDLEVYGSNIEFRKLRITDNWYAKPGAERLTFRSVDAAKFYITSASDIRVLGGRIGPSVDAVAQIKADEGSRTPSRAILIEGVTFQDFTRSTPEKHMECLHVMAVDGLVIRNSTFRRCTIYDISLKEHGSTDAMRNITIEKNVFDKPIDGRSAINLSTSGTPCTNVVIRENVFEAGISVTCSGEGIRIEGNELPSMSEWACAQSAGVTWDNNVYREGVPCGPNDVVRGG